MTIEAALRVGAIALVAVVLRWLAARAITRGVAGMRRREIGSKRVDARASAVASVLLNLTTWTVVVIAVLLALGEVDVQLAPLLAGAGVAGVAIGFGAQSLVRDVLAGIFVLIEDQYGVGDIIDAGPATGTVERVTLRSTQLRDLAGTVWHIPNGTITRVGNKSQNWARAVVEVVLSHDADVRAARAELRRVADAMAGEEPWAAAMRTGAEADEQGISALTPAGVTLRLVVDTEPKSQWQVERELRLRIKEAFDAAGIPFEVHHP